MSAALTSVEPNDSKGEPAAPPAVVSPADSSPVAGDPRVPGLEHPVAVRLPDPRVKRPDGCAGVSEPGEVRRDERLPVERRPGPAGDDVLDAGELVAPVVPLLVQERLRLARARGRRPRDPGAAGGCPSRPGRRGSRCTCRRRTAAPAPAPPRRGGRVATPMSWYFAVASRTSARRRLPPPAAAKPAIGEERHAPRAIAASRIFFLMSPPLSDRRRRPGRAARSPCRRP